MKLWAIALLIAGLPSMGGGPDFVDQRHVVERMLMAQSLYFHRENPESSLVFETNAGDSLKIECADCMAQMNDMGEAGHLKVLLQSAGFSKRLMRKDFGKWIGLGKPAGKLAIAFQRDGLGEKVIRVGSLKVWRKTLHPKLDKQGQVQALVRCKRLYIDPTEAAASSFKFEFKGLDTLRAVVQGLNGTASGDISRQVFQAAYDKQPLDENEAFVFPPLRGSGETFGLEFSVLPAGRKGYPICNVDILRTPAQVGGSGEHR